MRTEDDVLKLKAVVLYILEQFGGSEDYVKVFKLLYFAQRYSLANYGREIINDTFYARDRGPVPGFLNAAIKQVESPLRDQPWLDIIAASLYCKPDFLIASRELPDMDELSGCDKLCIDLTIDKYGAFSANELSGISHDDKGWKTADARRKADPDKSHITRLEMAEAGNASPELLQYLKEQIELDQFLTR